MSINVISLVMQRFPGKGREYAVMLAVADNAHDDGSHIHPSLDSIATKARISKSTARRVRDQLVVDGWLILEYQGGHGPKDPNRYCMNLERLRACDEWGSVAQGKGVSLAPKEKVKGVTTVEPLKDANLTPLENAKGVKTGAKGVIAVTPEPSLEPSVRDPDPYVRENFQPTTPREWGNWFHVIHKFSPSKAVNPSTFVMYKSWIEKSVSVVVVEEAMEIAHARNGNKPSSPAYYGWAVGEVLNPKPKTTNGVNHGNSYQRVRDQAVDFLFEEETTTEPDSPGQREVCVPADEDDVPGHVREPMAT